MAYERWPDTLPRVTESGYALALDAGLLQAGEVIGRSVLRRRYKTLPHAIGVTLLGDLVAITAAVAWLNKIGTLQFEIPLPTHLTAPGLIVDWHVVRLAPGSLRMVSAGFDLFSLTFTVSSEVPTGAI